MANSTYRFLPWARRGLADRILDADTGAALPARAKVNVGITVSNIGETPYALSKFIEAKDKTHGTDGHSTQFLFNLETETTLRNLDSMIDVAREGVDGVVFGRVDFTLSRGMARGARSQPVSARRHMDRAGQPADGCPTLGRPGHYRLRLAIG